ncbi:formate-dependent phosphoribosylglycinamide formyltransferase [Methylocaldum sp.]|uniref:formate-dependent phosphoribosylglycinamide formyltransferase n=1 Tax=Methylocaldum sp. TaxID=1969727 RepID=UPI002D610F2B|nr:formate-dependent phosphoribosylglycinamide formyltransferase [Methylocaldum sp.]HYE37053.1 formate-dependent phosphoribosylglycinamide formyltransferase [Methylocaldum sp.]
MKIGTALTRSATRVMLLGSGELGKEIAIALQRYGVEVVAVDRYPNAPAQHVSHCAHVIDMNDGEGVKRLVEMEKPHIIVPEIEAIATAALAEIEQAGGAVVVPTARAVSLTMNREGIRRLAAEELGLPTSPYVFADSLDSLRKAVQIVGYPCFVKPVMSSSGKGQSLLRSDADLEKAWEYAQSGGRVKDTKVIVEGSIDFDYEITLLTVRANNGRGGEETYFCEPIGHRQELGDYVESWQPQPMSETARSEAKRIAKAVTDNLGGRGLFGVELFVKGDRVWFSEVSPRPHDTGMVTMITQAQSEFELHARAILGLPVSTRLRNPGASAVIYGQLEGEGIAFEGVDEALAIPETEIRLFGKPISYPRRRVGVALAAGNSIDEARERAKKAAGLIKPLAG